MPQKQRSKQVAQYQETLEELYQFLRRFGLLTRVQFNQILPYVEIREVTKKVQLVKEGEIEDYINIIIRGLARKYLLVQHKQVTIQLAAEGHIVHSELSFHYQQPSKAIVETIEPTVLLSVSYDNLQKMYAQIPGMERLGRLIISDLFVRADIRYIRNLQKDTRERFLEYVRNHPQMLQRVPQKYIASYLNIKPETFSRLKHLLQKK